MTGTNGGGSFTSRDEDLACFDYLPASVRAVIREAPHNIGGASAVGIMRRRGYNAHEMVCFLKDFILTDMKDKVHDTYGRDRPLAQDMPKRSIWDEERDL